MEPPSSPNKPRAHATIIGGGPVGALLSLYLAKERINVDVYERRQDVRALPIISDRSINLALSARGLDALALVGLKDKVLEMSVEMKGRMVHTRGGKKRQYPFSVFEQCIYSVDRRKLNDLLLDAAESQPRVNIHFEHECLNVNLSSPSVMVEDSTGTVKTVRPDVVFGTDGAHSIVRRSMMVNARLSYEQFFSRHGYKELILPPKDDNYALDPKFLHMWPRGDFMLIALPNQDYSFTCSLFLPMDLFDALIEAETIVDFFRREFKDFIELVGEDLLVKDFLRHPVGSFFTVKCSPLNYQGHVLLLGDAAHCMVPFYGHGLNCGFEDVRILDSLLSKFQGDFSEAFYAFNHSRHKDVLAACDLALENYNQMTSHVISPWFHLKRQIFNIAHYFFPRTIIPLYSMVSFTHIPYHLVVKRQKRQEKWLAICGWTLFAGILGTVLFKKLKQ